MSSKLLRRRLDDVIARIARSGAKALLIGPSSHFNNVTQELGRLLCKAQAIRDLSGARVYGRGGLMSYGPGRADPYRIVGEYTGRVLKGAHPGDLPVQLQTKADFIVGLKAAKGLGLALPLPLVVRADEVIG